MSSDKDFRNVITKAYHLVLFTFGMLVATGVIFTYAWLDPDLSYFKSSASPLPVKIEEDFDKIENGIHTRTGLVEAEGLMTVVNNCTSCHSAKLIMQNRMSAARWNRTIKWMQETQNLGDLGSNQEIIVNYLVKNYPPKAIGRRENLSPIDWYELKD